MTLVAAAVCPHPPLIVPALAAGAATELDDVRRACLSAVGALASSYAPIHVVGVDTGERTRSFARWGVDVAVEVPQPAPLPHLVAAWLLSQVGAAAAGWHLMAADAPPEECARAGRELAADHDIALLVMGDGSARHSEKAPGYLDARAAAYDADVARAFAAADVGTLAGLGVEPAADLLTPGRAAWQVLAGAAAGGTLSCADALFTVPYGVGYHVVVWR